MLTLKFTTRFKKDYRIAQKRGYDISFLKQVIDDLANERPLPGKLRDHALSGNYQGFRERHIQPDWLLVYLVENGILTLTLVRTGTHSDLFGK